MESVPIVSLSSTFEEKYANIADYYKSYALEQAYNNDVYPLFTAPALDVVLMMFSAALITASAYICIQYIPKTLASGQVTEVCKTPFYIIYSVMTFGMITIAF